MEQSRSEAYRLGHNLVGTEHLLLGVLDVPAGLAAQVVRPSGVTRDLVLGRIGELVTTPAARLEAPDDIGWGPRAKDALEQTLAEALRMGHNYIGTEHMLLGILGTQGLGAQILHERGVDTDTARGRITEILSIIVTGKATPPTPPPAAPEE
jgi:ATP-dependent Clp protease ATP-binding subunit ClpC